MFSFLIEGPIIYNLYTGPRLMGNDGCPVVILSPTESERIKGGGPLNH